MSSVEMYVVQTSGLPISAVLRIMPATPWSSLVNLT